MRWCRELCRQPGMWSSDQSMHVFGSSTGMCVCVCVCVCAGTHEHEHRVWAWGVIARMFVEVSALSLSGMP